MEATEVRIGNLVATKLGNYIKVDADLIAFLSNRFTKGMNQPLPIPLTPKILVKAGFENVGFEIYTKNIYPTILLQIDGDSFGVKNSAGFIEIGHVIWVHQLQNLYFYLSQKELEINL
jgi:hypothetical protein